MKHRQIIGAICLLCMLLLIYGIYRYAELKSITASWVFKMFMFSFSAWIITSGLVMFTMMINKQVRWLSIINLIFLFVKALV